MDCISIPLYYIINHSKCFKIHTNIHNLIAQAFIQSANLLIRSYKGTHTLTHLLHSHQEEFGVQYFAPGHFNMQNGRVEDQTTNFLITGRTALPPEQQPFRTDKTYVDVKASLPLSSTSVAAFKGHT